jgi:hypothetical protein
MDYTLYYFGAAITLSLVLAVYVKVVMKPLLDKYA